MDYTDLVVIGLPIRQSKLATNHIKYTKMMPLTRWMNSKKIVLHMPKIGSIVAIRKIGYQGLQFLMVTSVQLPASHRQWMGASPILYVQHPRHISKSIHKTFIEYMNTNNLPLHRTVNFQQVNNYSNRLWDKSF